jgi:uncharacterized membrane protein YedE/YeeE
MKHRLETPQSGALQRLWALLARRSVLCLDPGMDHARDGRREELPMTELAPYAALAGGVLIGFAASVLLIACGRIAGVSGIAGNLIVGAPGDRAWRAAFLIGLLISGMLTAWLSPGAVRTSPRSVAAIASAGLLVGVGTRLGSGCTSGHGVCGLSRLSHRSLIATVTFILSGVITVTLLRWVGAGT